MIASSDSTTLHIAGVDWWTLNLCIMQWKGSQQNPVPFLQTRGQLLSAAHQRKPSPRYSLRVRLIRVRGGILEELLSPLTASRKKPIGEVRDLHSKAALVVGGLKVGQWQAKSAI